MNLKDYRANLPLEALNFARLVSTGSSGRWNDVFTCSFDIPLPLRIDAPSFRRSVREERSFQRICHVPNGRCCLTLCNHPRGKYFLWQR